MHSRPDAAAFSAALSKGPVLPIKIMPSLALDHGAAACTKTFVIIWHRRITIELGWSVRQTTI
jgi:hypothetical protein